MQRKKGEKIGLKEVTGEKKPGGKTRKMDTDVNLEDFAGREFKEHLTWRYKWRWHFRKSNRTLRPQLLFSVRENKRLSVRKIERVGKFKFERHFYSGKIVRTFRVWSRIPPSRPP